MLRSTGWRAWRPLLLAVVLGAAGGCDAGPEPSGPELRTDEPSKEEVPAPVVCFTSKECLPEEYCATAAGACGREGVCTALPTGCDRTRDPVCSCDGVDYTNSCWAASEKQNVDFAGSCPPPACTSNAECVAGSYCARATGDCAGTGACEVKPLVCSGAWNPVCGCNGKTYANACKAASVGAVIKKIGAC